MAAQDVIEARTSEKEKTRDAKKRKDEEMQDERPTTKEKAKTSKIKRAKLLTDLMPYGLGFRGLFIHDFRISNILLNQGVLGSVGTFFALEPLRHPEP